LALSHFLKFLQEKLGVKAWKFKIKSFQFQVSWTMLYKLSWMEGEKYEICWDRDMRKICVGLDHILQVNCESWN
jgi:hypothetical protein